MDSSDVITLGQEALMVAALIAGPLLLGILVVGVVIGLIQAATSVQEMTLSFIPKLIILVLLLFLIGNWQISVLVEHFQNLLMNIPIYLQ
ncbi:flagellar biosynthetic protein FliQ [Gammaproteobacteria bacterium]|jgi:flagellar biosynthetic protein FliQ|nr:flagellar biosynthetic protein FliQ [Gammaproteobacteria bacterium]MDB9968223.1 flagellar biosynthetic protein FliQ [Gammaproteobacteria bacterium]|tara:strand:- start:209 stop:478 length:270 start_codon:yes stop_codon:yes gene_type:complete